MDRRLYPERPVVGVGAVIVSDGKVVLIRRRFEPLAGRWTLPGGTLELGETLEAGVAREMLEETGLVVKVGPVIEVFDRILLDDEQRVRYHFVLVDYLCWPLSGTLAAATDVGATDGDVQLAILIASAFSMYNRLVDGFRTMTPPVVDAYRGGRTDEIAEHGYSWQPGGAATVR